MKRDITIGITGGIGAGKSVVSRVLRCNGFVVYDCDREAKNLMRYNKSLKDLIIDHFGEEVYKPDGELNKSLLASLIFNSNSDRDFVNTCVHEEVRKDILRRRKSVEGYFFIESAILATGGIEGMCQFIWLVKAPDDKRIERVMTRDNLEKTSIENRMNIQKQELSQLDMKKTVIIKNDGTSPMLGTILKLTEKYNNHQTYLLSC